MHTALRRSARKGMALSILIAGGALVGCCQHEPPQPYSIEVDDGSGLIEPGEDVAIRPSWRNVDLGDCAPITASGTIDAFSGPPGADYVVVDGSGVYTIPPGAARACTHCYTVSIPVPEQRPVLHWDVSIRETLTTSSAPSIPPGLLAAGLAAAPEVSGTMTWTAHVGESFTDVWRANPFYLSVETILHRNISDGCGNGAYCPESPVSRAQMAIFLWRAKHGLHQPWPPCQGVFEDVPCPDGFGVSYVEGLYREGVVAGCGNGRYCPDEPVTRAQMAALLLKEKNGSGYEPPPCTGVFEDVSCPGPFSDWIEELYRSGVAAGCSASPLLYCPESPNRRGQMAVFLTKTFELTLD